MARGRCRRTSTIRSTSEAWRPHQGISHREGKLATSPSSQTSKPSPIPDDAHLGELSPDGILWAVENTSPAVLHAYNAFGLTQELYNSNQPGSRDQFGPGNKFITPMIANGRVYVGTQTGVAVFGLLQ